MLRTISNLSREMKVSRPSIYTIMERLEIKKPGQKELTPIEWDALRRALSARGGVGGTDAPPVAVTQSANEVVNDIAKLASDGITSATVDAATMHLRLSAAKQEYDFNKKLITMFQHETDMHFASTGKLTVVRSNGALALIPALVSLEKYLKLNISLSRLISDLEGDLDLDEDGGEDPFA